MMDNYICSRCKGKGYIEYGSTEGDFTESCKECKSTGKVLITISLEEYQKLKELCKSKKPIIITYGIAFCPICNGSLWQNKDESNYCFRCGQKIDWSDSK